MSTLQHVPFVDLPRIHDRLAKPLEEAYRRVLKSSGFIQGKEVEAFENRWSEFCGIEHTIGCSNGTDALMLILLGLGIGRGDEVITVSNTFFATVEAIITVGATPVMVDARIEDGLIDVEAAAAAITAKTKAVIAVHLYGQPCDMNALQAFTEKHKLHLIEDAAQAHGAQYDGAHVGSFGIASAFSFFPGKNLGALGDAGAVVTRDAALAQEMRALRNHGRGPREKYSHGKVGYNMRMDELQAAFLSAKLPLLAEWVSDRRRIAEIYHAGLKGLTALKGLSVSDTAAHAYHLYVVRNDDRDGLATQLAEKGVASGVHYPLGCHQQPALASEPLRHPLENTEEICRTCLSLPIFGGMRDEEGQRVVAVLRELLE